MKTFSEALFGIIFLIGWYKTRSDEHIFWRGVSSALASLSIAFLAAGLIGLYVCFYGVSASNIARFQNWLVDACILLRSIVKPDVVIKLTVLGLGLSFITNVPVVRKLGIAVAFVGFAARTITVLGSFLFVGEAGASDIVNQAVEQLDLEYKKAEEKVDVAKAKYFAAAYVNSLVNNAQVRSQLASKMLDIYASYNGLSKDTVPSDVDVKFDVLNWAKSIVPKQNSDYSSIKTPQELAKRPVTATEYAQQRAFVDRSESASQGEVEQLSQPTTEVGNATRTILQNVISSFIPELPELSLEGALVFGKQLYENLTDSLAEGLTEKIVEGIEPQESVAQIHDAGRKELQSAGLDIEAAIEQKDFHGRTFKAYLTQLLVDRVEGRAKAEQSAAEFERERREKGPEIRGRW